MGDKGRERDATYQSKPWENLGPRALIRALENMNSPKEADAAEACEVFAVHLCEATRIRLISSTIVKSLRYEKPLELVGHEMTLVGKENTLDILQLLTSLIDLDVNIAAPPQVLPFIKGYKQVCVGWMGYVLSERQICPLEKAIADKCGIKFARTLRASLGTLSNTKLQKVVDNMARDIRKGNYPSIHGRCIHLLTSRLSQLTKDRSLSLVAEQ